MTTKDQQAALGELFIASTNPAIDDIVSDTTAPTLAITSNPAGPLKIGQTAVISFSFSEPVSGFERSDILVSGGELGALTSNGNGTSWTATFTPDEGVDNGQASITVEAGNYTDAAGNDGAAGTTPSIKFDTLAPDRPSLPALQPGSDTGVVGDNITSDSTPTFSGAAGSVEGLATVRLYAGATLIGETTAAADGSWSASSNIALTNATYQITVIARDTVGNASVASEPLTLVIDTSAPGAPARPVLASASDSGVKNDNITNAVTQTIGGAAGSAEGGSVITLYSGGVAIQGASTTANLDGSWSIDLPLPDGSHAITARATDKAGTLGAVSPVLTLTVDRVAPDQPQAPLLHADSNSGSTADTITNDRTPTFYGANGSVEGGAAVNLYADGEFIGSTVAAADGSWSLAVNQLGSGTHVITAEAVDVAGNVSIASSGTSLTIDYTPPTAQVDGVKFSEDTGVTGDFVTGEANQVVSGMLTAPLAQGEWLGVSLDNGVNYAPANVDADGVAWSLGGVQISGKGTLLVRVFDAAGNAGEGFSHVYEYDATAPGKPSTPDLTAASDSGDDADNITGVTRPIFTGTAEKDAIITLYAGEDVAGSGRADADGKWSVIVDSALPDATYDFTVRATDLAGNQSAASDALAVTIITAAPGTENLTFTLSADSGIGGDRVTNVANQTLEGTLSAELASGEKVEVYLDGAWQKAQADAGDTSWSLGATLKQGEHQVEVRVVNAIGNPGPVEKYTYTLDTEAPTVEITSDKSTLKAGESATITFTFSDDPGAALSVNAIEVTGGTVSQVGGTGLVRTAVFTPTAGVASGSASISIDAGLFTDLAGNNSESGSLTSLTFDTLAPAAPSAPVLDTDSDSGVKGDGITVFNKPTFTGTAESGVTVTLYNASGNPIGSGAAADGKWSIELTDPLAEGTHVISARAVDAAGNESEAATSDEITIDFTPPTLTITSNVDQLKIGEAATISFTFSEDPGDTFDGKDIQLSGGTLGELERDGLTFTATFTPHDNANTTTAIIAVGAGTYSDAAGNNGGPGVLSTLVFDTKAPPAPSIPDLVAESDTGSEDDDDITGDTTPTFSGTAEAGATVTLFAGNQEIGSVVATDGTWRITSEVVPVQDEYDITAVATDAAGNVGPASQALKIEIVTDAPTTKASSLKFSADTGASQTDLVTRTAAQTISGALDGELKAGEYVEVSVDGGKHWNRASIDAEGWSIATTLLVGEDSVAVRVVNAIGNPGEEYARDYRLDTLAPSVEITSNVSELKRGETATITFTFSEDPGATFTWDGAMGDVAVTGGVLSAISGSGITRSATFTPTDGVEGDASIKVNHGGYADLAGNSGVGDELTALEIDTLAPGAPDAPALAADSDTGDKGDGRTNSTTQVIEGGGADPGAMVHLYHGNQRIGSSQASGDGLWSMNVALAAGSYALSVTQEDKAGNESASSAPFQLTVTASNPTPNPDPTPNPQPIPPTVIDGMPVTTTPVILPGGVHGTTIVVPIVTGSRNETEGQANLADIPLAASGGQIQLLAQLPVGYGLTSSGASVGAANGLALLIGAIRAATPTHGQDEQNSLVQNGTSFLQGLSYSQLLVHTVMPVGSPGTSDALVLTGYGPGRSQGTALVIETGQLGAGATIELASIDFAALIGAATVHTGSSGTILAGDGASQHFTVLAGNGNQVYAGGGSDLLGFMASAPVDAGSANGRASAQLAPASGTTTLHGGQGSDVATFAGKREDFDVVFHHGHVVVNSKAAPDAKALVVNAEQLQFSDGAVAVENAAGLTTLAGMYQTVLGRQADLYGFEFWADRRDDGVSWGAIALDMIASGERLAQHGDFNGDAANDIGLLYQALFNRAADVAGLAFWTAAMNERGMSLEQVAGNFVESVEMVGHQRAVQDWDFQV